ncbi:MAG: transcriptional regulator [Methylococcaceae bacterium]|nr:transcriptional regulator [Methylococcaceae bacterium]
MIDLDAIRPAWAQLTALTDLGPVRDEAHYDRLVALMDSLLDEGAGDDAHPLSGLLFVVGEAIYAWDQRVDPLPSADPAGMLAFLMEQHGLSQSDLPEVGSQGVMSELLSGKRKLNLRQVKALAQRFGVGMGAFVDGA